ncbi:MAG: hypothetical protein A4E57_03810 [Syntrophorhabdaceae bacterium PtaU1.Bin034]|nr:MAG: hypothetical protein A4E57_03810 [Syntrophorhabdaceae bacterium PtaU1.Bin034]
MDQSKQTMAYLNRIMTVTGILLLLLAACSPAVIKGYPGPTLPGNQTALVETGAYTVIEGFDGQRATGDAVVLLPGPHTLHIRPNEYQQPMSQYWFYSPVIGSVNFNAEAGHTYRVYVDFVVAPGPVAEEKGSGFRWVGYILDRSTNRTIANTGLLPLDAEPRIPPTLRPGFPGFFW